MQTKLDKWNSLVQEVTLPEDISYAIMCNRPQLIRDRDLSPEESRMVLNLVRVLMETNWALQEHSAELAEKVKMTSQNARGIWNSLCKLSDFAQFKEEVEDSEKD